MASALLLSSVKGDQSIWNEHSKGKTRKSEIEKLFGACIASGKYSAVYQLNITGLTQEYVIKVMAVRKKESLEKFQKECRLFKEASLAAIAPSYLAEIYLRDETNTQISTVGMVSQKIQFSSLEFLKRWILNEKRDLDQLIEFLYRTAVLVERVFYELGEVYVDLKPDNIVVSLDKKGELEKVFLIDFCDLSNPRCGTDGYGDFTFLNQKERLDPVEEAPPLLLKKNTWILMTIFLVVLSDEAFFNCKKLFPSIEAGHKEVAACPLIALPESKKELGDKIKKIALEVFTEKRVDRENPLDLGKRLVETLGSDHLKEKIKELRLECFSRTAHSKFSERFRLKNVADLVSSEEKEEMMSGEDSGCSSCVVA